ncbi:Protein CBR-KAP-1 [Caenorhabditis briggsae]|uniref:Protein CBR-KAP-1 n=1 Tax=Caenorhabditis briggsae TaxID=6238 RepID=A8WNH7_CAEBR|nr:Protein CBR-KAP-1 [Caenorhabditis briggsae]CAP22031.2 Protein CBR-KAP-1 [Caenorhabditis briggsae]
MHQVTIDAHPTEQAIVVRFDQSSGSPSNTLKKRASSANVESLGYQKVINLKELSPNVDIRTLSNVILQICLFIPATSRSQLEQVLYFLQKRGTPRMSSSRSRSSSTVSFDRRSSQAAVLNVDLDKVDEYIECFYGETSAEKNKGAVALHELSKTPQNLTALVNNGISVCQRCPNVHFPETLMMALARVFREDWKKHFDVATNIMNLFVNMSKFSIFHGILLHHKIGSLCVNAIEHETKRYDLWIAEMKKADQETQRKLKNAIRKQAMLLAACITMLTNLATDISVELKMVRRNLVVLLVKCLQMSSDSPNPLTTSTVKFLLKLSIFEENKIVMEQNGTIEKLLKLFPIHDLELRKATIQLLFNFSFDPKNVPKMVNGGLVPHMSSLIESDNKALNMLYLLSCNDDAKAMLAYTDAIQSLMRDVLSGRGSEVTKAVLLNICLEKRNAQLVCGAGGQGLDLLIEMSMESRDLMLIKVIRAISSHDGPTQNMFLKWIDKLLDVAKSEGTDNSESKSSFGLECMGAVAEIKVAPWAKIIQSHSLVPWMKDQLQEGIDESQEVTVLREIKPLQLQIVITCGTMARQLDAARLLVPLIDTFVHLLQSCQIDDEFVVQLLYVFLQLLKHKDLSARLMTQDSELGAHMIDLMHDANAAVREVCDNALLIMGEHSEDWAKRIAGERFKWHNAQWLEMVERDDHEFNNYDNEDFGADFNFDNFDDDFDMNEKLF